MEDLDAEVVSPKYAYHISLLLHRAPRYIVSIRPGSVQQSELGPVGVGTSGTPTRLINCIAVRLPNTQRERVKLEHVLCTSIPYYVDRVLNVHIAVP